MIYCYLLFFVRFNNLIEFCFLYNKISEYLKYLKQNALDFI